MLYKTGSELENLNFSNSWIHLLTGSQLAWSLMKHFISALPKKFDLYSSLISVHPRMYSSLKKCRKLHKVIKVFYGSIPYFLSRHAKEFFNFQVISIMSTLSFSLSDWINHRIILDFIEHREIITSINYKFPPYK